MACDCGYLYILAGKAARQQLAQVANINILMGGFLVTFGLLITAGSYLFSDSAYGLYVIYWGAIVFGGIRFFRGMRQRREVMNSNYPPTQRPGGPKEQ